MLTYLSSLSVVLVNSVLKEKENYNYGTWLEIVVCDGLDPIFKNTYIDFFNFLSYFLVSSRFLKGEFLENGPDILTQRKFYDLQV